MMDRRWLPLNALRAFEAVARHLSFTEGGQALHISQSAISRHVIGLEALLGRRLLERRPQGLALTEAGATLLPAVQASLDRLAEVLDAIRRKAQPAPRRLRMHMPPTFLQMLGLPILQEFRREFPDIVIDVSSAYATGLPAGEIDVAVVYDRPLVSDSVRDLLWMVRVTPVCSPEVAGRAAGLGLAEFLRGHELLHVRVDDRPRGMLWADFVRRFGIDVPTNRGVAFDTGALAAQCATSGVGVALVDVDMFAGEIAAGRLVAPFPEAVLGDAYGYYLTFHPEDLADPAVALFRSWMIRRFGAAGAEGWGAGPPATLQPAPPPIGASAGRQTLL